VVVSIPFRFAWQKKLRKKEKPKKIFSRAVPDAHPGLVQQTVQIVVRFALTI